MSHLQLVILVLVLVFLILLSGFFSAAETGLMAINRYRLRHKARMKRKTPQLILKLLQRPDRLLGMILIGNTCANIFASALATLLAVQFFGGHVFFLSFLLALVVLIFAEVAPKTLAALYPDRISSVVAWPIYGLLTVFYPVVWLLNMISNGLLRLLGVRLTDYVNEPLSREELRSVVYETSGRISSQYQQMLLGILDLNKLTVNDVMIPRHEMVGIDSDAEWSVIQQQIATSEHDWMPVYQENRNQIAGILHLRDLLHESLKEVVIDKSILMSILHEPYFVPEATPLNTQLDHFQRERKRLALVVDEYGEILGLITLEDILEEIVGEFTTTISKMGKILKSESDGSFLIDGAITIRELNRATHFKLPTKGPRTLNGLIVEYLEMIPRSGICIRIADYPIEIVDVKENRVKMARVFPSLRRELANN